MESDYRKTFARFDSVDSSDSSGSFSFISRGRSRSLWRPSSLVNLVSPRKPTLHASISTDRLSDLNSDRLSDVDYDKSKLNNLESKHGGWDAIVNVILVEAKGLPDAPSDGLYHSLYCKIRLGSESHKSKAVSRSRQPQWMEKLKLHLYRDHLLKITLWDKATQRNFMGCCVIDLSKLVRDRTHDIWETLDDGFGSLHINITLCSVGNESTGAELIHNLDALRDIFALSNIINTNWREVGKLQVRVMGAKGLGGKPSVYCTLEVDNERVQTHCVRRTAEPVWDKLYEFNIYDITTTLELAVHDSAFIALRDECIGQVTIPLLRINSGEMRWYALKNSSKRGVASGNCPRVLLEMNLVWNPLKAALKLFQPKEEKYVKNSPKFSPELLYHNVVALGAILGKGPIVNEYIVEFLEWENRELCGVMLLAWLVFWYNFEWWMLPLILLLPFIYYWLFYYQNTNYGATKSTAIAKIDDDPSFLEILTGKSNDLADKVQRAPETALLIKKSVDFIIFHAEKLHNLLRFKVPFISYFVMISLVVLSAAIHYLSFKHFMIALGVYKYMRKYLNPERKPNNDILDFLSRLPDNGTLKNWKEFSVPEPIIDKENVMGRSSCNLTRQRNLII